jgi:Platelet-activating factor acetylhydrolase, isoform II
MPSVVASFEDTAFSALGIPIPHGTFARLQLPVCTNTSSPPLSAHSSTSCLPLLLFSPGAGNSRLLYSALASAVASSGAVVITIDHPYDANIVAFPDGSIVYGTVSDNTTTDIDAALAVRVADTRFVLDTALRPGTLPLPPLLETVGMWGHSLGGATAAQAMIEDRRIGGGVNLDGSFWGSVVDMGVEDPFLLFAREGHNQSNDASWASFWGNSRGWREQLTLLNSTHGTFEDLLLLAEELGIEQELPPGTLVPLLGSLEGRRALKIIWEYVTAFFGFVLTGEGEGLLSGPSGEFPEVVFSNSSTGRA